MTAPRVLVTGAGGYVGSQLVAALAGGGSGVGRVLATVTAIKTELDALRRLKVQLTSIRGTAGEVAVGLDRLRDAILARVGDAEAQLQAGVAEGAA